MPAQLQNQIQRIIEEGKGTNRRVIIQVQTRTDREEKLMQAVVKALQRRTLKLSAREMLPVTQETLTASQTQKPSQSVRRLLRETDASLASQVLRAGIPRVSVEKLKASGLKAIDPLLRNEVIARSVEKHKAGSKDEVGVVKLWSANSIALEMSKDDLNALAKQNAELERIGVENIYPNRELRVPDLVEARNLPTHVIEQTACSWGLHKINALAAWGAYGARGEGIRIGLLDTGVDPDHPDLVGKIEEWAEFDGDGRHVPNSTPHDSGRHGTHCAGVLVGGNRSGKWIGVAPGARLVAALVLKKEKGTQAQMLAGLQWAIEQKVDVVSMSLGGLTFDIEPPDPYADALFSAVSVGIPVVTAIGNDGNQTTSTPGNDLFAFAVGATDNQDRAAGFSGGRTHLVQYSKYLEPASLPLTYFKPEVSAPGVGVYSCVPDKKYAAFNGTSMATPHVAGAIALLLSATSIRNNVSEVERAFLIQDLITGSVRELGEAGQDHRFGFGRIDILRTIANAKRLNY